MNPFIEKIIPLILAFVVGIAAKHLKMLDKTDAPVLLRFVLSISLPALTILSIYKAELTLNMAFIPISAMLIVFIIYFISFYVGKLLKLPQGTFGSFLVGTMIMNTSFVLPFFWAAYENEGLVRASLFDIGNSLLIFTFIYFNAIKYGENAKTDKIDWSKFLKLPPLWGMVIAFVIKGFAISIPNAGLNFLSLVGQPTTPLIMIALGLYFEPQAKNIGYASLAIFIRMGIGLLIGWGLATLFGLQGISRTVVIVSAATPCGFNTLIFANLENMDREFAATIVSISLLIALFLIPLLIFIFG